MPSVVLLELADTARLADAGASPRVPALTCADALRAGGATVTMVTAGADSEIDSAIEPVVAGQARLIVAAGTDGEVRAVVRRLTRRQAPPPSKRPAHLPPDRTVFDLPPLAVLSLAPAMPALVAALGLPRDPIAVATAVLAGRERRLDLLRTDSGSVTVHGCLLGGVDRHNQAAPWWGRVEVDDAVLSDGTDPVVACSIRNTGPSAVDGLPLVTHSAADDGMITVAVAVPVAHRRALRKPKIQFEVRRAHGRAVSVTPRDDADHPLGDGLPFVDDGVVGRLSRKRVWWIERGAWAVYM